MAEESVVIDDAALAARRKEASQAWTALRGRLLTALDTVQDQPIQALVIAETPDGRPRWDRGVSSDKVAALPTLA